MPVGLLRAFLAMLPRLQAEAELSAVQVAAVSRVTQIEPKDADRWLSDQNRAIAGETDAPPRAAPATPEGLAAMGIGIVMVEPAHV